uniref:Uncharacterized protein n=1 Tax=Chromera velia CCMP2878 TaxID=1169474 RepID=A0A0G4I3I4_9ALVE|eukprot:Cvel_10687.t1-p1 / transcript=Cvel_10687.t1 / gene=Cvel_10687 / organism=Chromera_velia_CCMP2878 / gene_product=hypothetical protein / transcript_product=hypothetical protein / location=Cvel_scaffold649:61012-63621(+) / protein_length=345 / sequence_SO=supercontig / SO=protein_coding / is_pseudo=false
MSINVEEPHSYDEESDSNASDSSESSLPTTVIQNAVGDVEAEDEEVEEQARHEEESEHVNLDNRSTPRDNGRFSQGGREERHEDDRFDYGHARNARETDGRDFNRRQARGTDQERLTVPPMHNSADGGGFAARDRDRGRYSRYYPDDQQRRNREEDGDSDRNSRYRGGRPENGRHGSRESEREGRGAADNESPRMEPEEFEKYKQRVRAQRMAELSHYFGPPPPRQPMPLRMEESGEAKRLRDLHKDNPEALREALRGAALRLGAWNGVFSWCEDEGHGFDEKNPIAPEYRRHLQKMREKAIKKQMEEGRRRKEEEDKYRREVLARHQAASTRGTNQSINRTRKR